MATINATNSVAPASVFGPRALDDLWTRMVSVATTNIAAKTRLSRARGKKDVLQWRTVVSESAADLGALAERFAVEQEATQHGPGAHMSTAAEVLALVTAYANALVPN